MLRRAVVISVMLHFVVLVSLLDIPRSDVPTGGRRLGFVDVVIREAPKKMAGVASETARSPMMQSEHVARLQPLEGKAQSGKNLNFDQNFRSTAAVHRVPSPAPSVVTIASPDGEPIIPVEAEIEYRLSLARLARGAVPYPEQARQRGLQGIVVVLVTSGAGHGAPGVTLERSSGTDILDHRALEAVQNAVAQAPLPLGLRAAQFRISVPMEFSLTR